MCLSDNKAMVLRECWERYQQLWILSKHCDFWPENQPLKVFFNEYSPNNNADNGELWCIWSTWVLLLINSINSRSESLSSQTRTRHVVHDGISCTTSTYSEDILFYSYKTAILKTYDNLVFLNFNLSCAAYEISHLGRIFLKWKPNLNWMKWKTNIRYI